MCPCVCNKNRDYVLLQGNCNSCWAFAAVGGIEGQYRRQTGQLIPLSAQQLVDCAGGYCNNAGCAGGFGVGAFDYVRLHGIMKECDYPYNEIVRLSIDYHTTTDIAKYSIANLFINIVNAYRLVPANSTPPKSSPRLVAPADYRGVRRRH